MKEWRIDDTARREHQSFQICQKKKTFSTEKELKQTWGEITSSRKTPHRNQNRNNYQKIFHQNNNNRRDINSTQSHYQRDKDYNNGNNTAKYRSRARSPFPQFKREQNQPKTRTNHRIRNISPAPAAQQHQWSDDNRAPRYRNITRLLNSVNSRQKIRRIQSFKKMRE